MRGKVQCPLCGQETDNERLVFEIGHGEPVRVTLSLVEVIKYIETLNAQMRDMREFIDRQVFRDRRKDR